MFGTEKRCYWLIAFIGFFMVRCLIVVIFVILEAPDRAGPVTPQEFGTVVSHAAFAINPADPHSTKFYLSFPDAIFMYLDLPSLVIVVAGWWAFRLAAGKRRRLIAAPVVILIGLTGTITGCVLMLCDVDPEKFGAGFLVSMITTLYGFIGAAWFLISDMRSNPGANAPGSCASSPALDENIEQAKQIIDNVVKKERGA